MRGRGVHHRHQYHHRYHHHLEWADEANSGQGGRIKQFFRGGAGDFVIGVGLRGVVIMMIGMGFPTRGTSVTSLLSLP